ncbi:MAG: hypothetical protein WCT13_05510 [Patescibacteria group bacterium]|jgi:hypothetical protein
MTDTRENKNAVFQQQTSAQQGISAVERVKAEFGLDIPIEVVPLPSLGAVYPVGSPLHGRETIEIRSMTAREEDILTSRALLKKGTVITELIKSCMTDKSFEPSSLLIGDRNALLVAIRITGYGHEYDVEMECNECGVKSPRTFDLSQLPIKQLRIEPTQPGVNSFEFLLPYSKKVVNFRFMTGKDEEEISTAQEKMKKAGFQTDSNVTTNLTYSIESIDGITDRSKISNFVRSMPARDSLALRSYIRENEPGIDMNQEVVCSACGHSEAVNMPLGTGFLWPTFDK